MSNSLYEEDLVRWSEEQARAIREAATARTNLPIDWENVAEEIDSLGRSQRTQLRNRIRRIIEHLIKLQLSPAQEPRNAWRETIREQRRRMAALLDDSPSLRREVADMIQRVLPQALDDMLHELQVRGETPQLSGDSINYGEEQVLGDWFPEYHPATGKPTTKRRGRRASQDEQ